MGQLTDCKVSKKEKGGSYLKPILFDTEIWKPVKGYEGKYEISNHGRVKSLDSHHISHKEKIMKPWEANKKYLYITLRNGSVKKTYAVHQLVLDTFVGVNPGGKQCAHWDGSPHNNHVNNLRWATAKENCADRDRHERTAKGSKQGNAKLDEKAARTIIKLKDSGLSKYEVSHLACVSYTTVERIWKGENWRHVM